MSTTFSNFFWTLKALERINALTASATTATLNGILKICTRTTLSSYAYPSFGKHGHQYFYLAFKVLDRDID
jgi:hypothetical protein